MLNVTLRFPVREGRLQAAIDRDAKVLARRYEGETVELEVTIDRTHLNRLLSGFDVLKVLSTNGLAPAV